MAIAEKQIAQVVLTTSSATIVTASSETLIIKQIRAVETSGAAVDFTIYHDDDGTTYSTGTMIQPAVELPANGVMTDNGFIAVSNGGSIGAKASANTAITLTLYGASIT